MKLKKKKILIVEDERIVAEDMAQCLELAGYEISGIAKSGAEALEIAREHSPDIALMDIVIRGDMDGIETAALMKEQFGVPFVYLTAYSQDGVLKRAIATEPLAYVVKPFEEASLISTVEIALHKAGLDEELKHSLEWFYTTLKCIGDGVIATDPLGNIVFMNNVAEQLTNWELDNAKGRFIEDVFQIVNETTGRKVENPALKALSSQHIVGLDPGTILVAGDGNRMAIDDAGSPIRNAEGKLIGAVLIFRDITKQRESEEEVQNYQQRLEELVAKRTAALERRIELESLITSVSLELIRIDDDSLSAGIEDALRKIGEFIGLDRCTIYQTDSPGAAGRIYRATHDWVAESEGSKIDSLPEHYGDETSWWASQVYSQGYIRVRSHDDIPVEATRERQLLVDFGFQSFVALPLGELRKIWGTLVLCSHQPHAWSDDDVRILRMLAQFIETVLERHRAEQERIRLSEELTQSRKLEAIGKLSGGIAHDFNNMLVPIIGYSDVLLEDLAPNEERRAEVVAIRSAAESAAALTRQLLAFSRKQILKKVDTDIRKLVEGMRTLLDRLLGEDVRLTTRSPDDVVRVLADRSQLEQVIMNLCVNARDAMSEGGEIAIRIERRLEAKEEGDIPAEVVCLSVRDTGIGMDRETLARIFDPFYSTKGMEGTGLGLSVVLGVVEQHDGWVTVDSTPGEGTEFRVFIPVLSEENADSLPSRKGIPRSTQGNNERILLVEDESIVIQFVGQALRKHGYDVVTAMCVSEAFQRFDENNGEFDLIFSDAMLPDGTGMEVVERLLDRKPDLAALLSSGYSDHRALREVANERRIAFLHKPYSLTDLYEIVRSVLNRETAVLLS